MEAPVRIKEVVINDTGDAIAYFGDGEILFMPDDYGSSCILVDEEVESLHDDSSPWVKMGSDHNPDREGFTKEEIELWNKHVSDHPIE